MDDMGAYFVVTVALLWIFTHATDATSSCLACKDQATTIDCDRTQRCGKYEDCYLDSFVNPNGYINYNMGCRDNLLCSKPSGRRSLANVTSRDVRSTDNTVVCSLCCQGDLCNSALCGETGFPVLSPSTRGPICYDCPSHLNPDDCNIITRCSRDERCLLHYESGRYVSRCAPKSLCDVIAPAIVGKRATGTTCPTRCCDTDLCNGDCQNSGSSAGLPIGACLTNPCLHGRCSPYSTTYTCTCTTGYTGRNCDISHVTDPCVTKPCLHGTCSSTGDVIKCTCNAGYHGTLCDKILKARDCKDIKDLHMASASHDNIYQILIGSSQRSVTCDMHTDGGGWTVIMNRKYGNVSFDRNFNAYALGIGDPTGDFWLGLHDMHLMTSTGISYMLRVQLTDHVGRVTYETYSNFSVGVASTYKLSIHHDGGTAGDYLSNHNGRSFSTPDRDQDIYWDNCAGYYRAGWWFHQCITSCLTCPYGQPGHNNCQTMAWHGTSDCTGPRSVSMMIRPM